MKLKSNFILGLGTGVLSSLALVVLMGASSGSGPATDQTNATNQTVVDPVKGGYISSEEAAPLISAYASDFVQGNNLPANTTIGGYIGKENLQSIANGAGESEYVKFSFYLTTDENNAQQIGLIFYPNETAAQVLRTGSASFCPSLCNSPD